MSVDVLVSVDSGDWHASLPGAEHLARTAAEAACQWAAPRRLADATAEVSLVLADDSMVRQLNHDHRGQDRPTNVLAFAGVAEAPEPASGVPWLLGDVVVAFETAAREAATAGTPLANHLRHLVVHGVLHLLGYDHDASSRAEEMTGLERRILEGLGVPDPYGTAARPGTHEPT